VQLIPVCLDALQLNLQRRVRRRTIPASNLPECYCYIFPLSCRLMLPEAAAKTLTDLEEFSSHIGHLAAVHQRPMWFVCYAYRVDPGKDDDIHAPGYRVRLVDNYWRARDRHSAPETDTSRQASRYVLACDLRAGCKPC